MRGKNDAVARGNQADGVINDVAAGLVEGVTEATTPQGAFSLKSGRCRLSAPAEKGTQRLGAARLSDVFGKFIFYAAHTRSLTASSAKSLACFSPASRMAQWLTGALPRSLTLAGQFWLRNGVIQGRENAHLMNGGGRRSLLCIFSSTAFTTCSISC